MPRKTFIIAEAGVNHNGSLEMAFRLVDAARDSGADAVKFQTFKTDKNISKTAPKAAYQLATTPAGESQYDMVKKLELSESDHLEIVAYCKKQGIQFLSTAFDLGSVDLLVRLGVKLLKIPSGEVTNAPLILKVASAGLPLLMSTGMCTIEDIENALGVVAFGYLGLDKPSQIRFKEAFSSEKGQALLKKNVTLLHCTTEYPAPVEDTNLRAIESMRSHFGLPVGYSDHTEGISVSVAAVALGATIIEKHFTLDRNLPGPDHKASLEPGELKQMVKAIRQVETALGDGVKRVAPSEAKNQPIARRSLVAVKEVKKGELFTEENLGFMRPGDGISPMHYWEFLGKPADSDYHIGEQIR